MLLRSLGLVAAAHLLAATVAAQTSPIDYSVAYEECTKAVHVGAAEALAKCELPAGAGITGAQYVMGALLTNRNSGDDMVRGMALLEKAAAAGSPAAAHHLAGLLMQGKDQSSVSRGRQLFRAAVCAGYPEAVKELSEAGLTKESLSCKPSPETDFNGEWLVRLRWNKTAPPGAATDSYRVTVDGESVHVYGQIDGKWIEVKPGKFTIARQDESMTVAANDTGWDFDGKWIESWTIQFMRTAPDAAAVAYLRTVNNPHLPAQITWKTFATFAEGSATRVNRP